MYEMNFNQTGHIYFTGIGGISMSGLAQILLSKKFRISGSDTKESALTRDLVSLGANINYEQIASNINDSIDVLVYTAAVKQDNPELVAAKELGIPTLTRAEFLGQIMKNYDISIGVSGTHGKTTTTSMISQILLQADTDPTILVGGIMKSINGNIRVGKSNLMITEACEYTNSFLSFFPTIGIILNVCADHMDFFNSLDEIRESFRKYSELLPENGLLVINGEIDNLSYFTDGLKCKVVTFGTDSKFDYSFTNLTYNHFACGEFDIVYDGNILEHIELKVPGLHNVLNAMAAVATCLEINLPVSSIKEGLALYTGTDRRFQYKGTINGATVIDDYAHHPDEISATLETTKTYPHNETWCVFQPHTYSRTKAFLEDFAKALSIADHIILAPIYAARETDTLGISSLNLLEELKKLGADAYHFDTFDEIEQFLLKNILNDDLLITMGAGDVVLIGENLISK
ncbi:MAG: UDP-N-acetylmuramate--L-alanine ligase [Lachnospiraceae bacterium]|nr:UDP-N-acetylmuramate--L-alanine ligase [Lachnospiraceae bacterium]